MENIVNLFAQVQSLLIHNYLSIAVDVITKLLRPCDFFQDKSSQTFLCQVWH